MAVSTTAATEDSGNRQSSDPGHRPPSSNQAHLADWDWERDRSSLDVDSDGSAQPYGHPRSRVESTSTTRELRYVLRSTLIPHSSPRQTPPHHRGRAEQVQSPSAYRRVVGPVAVGAWRQVIHEISLPPLTMIVAATRTNGIGLARTNGLPWRLPKEMAYFARVTSAAPEGKMNAVVMGRNTWESIPERFRPLKGRWNVVLSRAEMPQLADVPNTVHLSSISDLISSQPPQPLHRIFVIGGAALYRSLVSHPSLDRVLLTRVLSPAYEACDVFFPPIIPLPDPSANADDTSVPSGGEVVEKAADWSQASFEELQSWVGVDVPQGVQEEKGTQYEFQMWIRRWVSGWSPTTATRAA
ncbi:hypothetical protein CALCODRAFT_514961 [Calocera cornea HHB12733]|uniref:Dihydrofolate reductase n=1 Tax=Calocera cornea HHB12733 TaxID=1353952 RepID=A0A165IV52_9BASI|nr:hypothetical protein CALCODRAFT_514961 [Calocera cornea HHB12733]